MPRFLGRHTVVVAVTPRLRLAVRHTALRDTLDPSARLYGSNVGSNGIGRSCGFNSRRASFATSATNALNDVV